MHTPMLATGQTDLTFPVFEDKCPYIFAYVMDTPFEVDEP